ncbi:MAG: ATP-binding protein [Chloroflexi bacterium]|nr:ATP-binding protein [Chloroflexota bacterium]MBI3167638.1 ATP-binding protein [Chloroflexota bacterium]
MITFSEFFKLNQEIILFVYGLVFFLLGFAIILQTRRSSQLDLARNLRWLAAFGITHGIYEWGDLFIPIQAEYLSETTAQLMHFFHKILLAVSFLCLFEFGIAVIPSSRRSRWLHKETVLVFVVWVTFAFIIFPGDSLDSEWRRTTNAFARYFIGLPGGLLAAYGLRAHTLQRIAPLNVPKIVQMFRIAGVSLALYTLLAGTTPPPVDFFPGNILNTQTFEDFTGVPPMVFRSLFGAVVALTIIRALEIFDLETERRIEQLEQQQIINAEHERLARDLHDGAIQKVYTAGLLVESAEHIADPESELGKRLKRAVGVLSDSILDLRRNLAELHAHTQTSSEPLAVLLHEIAVNPNYNSMVKVTVQTELPGEKSMSERRTGHLLAIVNEAMANAVRHAKAESVQIQAKDGGEALRIQIQDNGKGLPSELKDGYGLRNMRDRTRLLNGKIEFENNRGLLITLEVPWKD